MGPGPIQKRGVRALKLSETPAPFDSSLLPVMALLKYRFKPQLHTLHIHDSGYDYHNSEITKVSHEFTTTHEGATTVAP